MPLPAVPDLLTEIAGTWAGALLDASAKATALLLGGLVVARALRSGPAAARHFVWAATVAGLLLLPVLSGVLPPLEVPGLPSVSGAFETPAAGTPSGPRPPASGAEEPGVATLPAGPHEPRADGAAARRSPDSWLDAVPTAAVVAAVWLLGALVVLGRGATARLRVWWMARSATPMRDGRWSRLRDRLARRLGLRREVDLLRGSAPAVPMTWGLLRPRVLLPPEAGDWSPSFRRNVLLHELAHVRRGDYAMRLLGRAAVALYWFHPLAWVALRRMRRAQEEACDDHVLRAGARPSDYARQLLRLARRLQSLGAGAHPAGSGRRRSEFSRRLRSMLRSDRPLRPVPRTRRAAGGVAAAVLVAVLAALGPAEHAPAGAGVGVELAARNPVGGLAAVRDLPGDAVAPPSAGRSPGQESSPATEGVVPAERPPTAPPRGAEAATEDTAVERRTGARSGEGPRGAAAPPAGASGAADGSAGAGTRAVDARGDAAALRDGERGADPSTGTALLESLAASVAPGGGADGSLSPEETSPLERAAREVWPDVDLLPDAGDAPVGWRSGGEGAAPDRRGGRAYEVDPAPRRPDRASAGGAPRRSPAPADAALCAEGCTVEGTLRRLRRRQNPEARLHLLRRLAREPTGRAGAVLMEISQRAARAEDRRLAVRALAGVGGKVGDRYLFQVARANPWASVRAAAVRELGRSSGEEVVPWLVTLVYTDVTPEVQKFTVSVLARLDRSGTSSGLLQIARSHPEDGVRREAVYWLLRTGRDAALTRLIESA